MTERKPTSMQPFRDAARARTIRTALCAALIYTLAGVLWIIFSDRALQAWFQDPSQIARLQTLKGWFYVLVTAGLVYLLVRRAAAHTEALAVECAERQLAVDELRASELRLRLTSDQLRATVDSAPIGMLTCARDGAILSANPAFANMLDRTPAELVGLRFEELSAAEAGESITADTDALWQDQNRIDRREQRLRARDGRLVDALVTSTLVSDPGGEPLFTVTMVRNITEQKHAEARNTQLEAQLRQAQKMEAIGQLAGGVAHDFNNILTAILGNTELTLLDLEVDLSAPRGLTTSLHEIQDCARRAAGLTQQLLAVSRRQITQPQMLTLNRMLADITPMLRRLISTAIRFESFPADDLWTIHADPGHMEQVIMNLVVNARDAMPQGGLLAIRTANVNLNDDDAAIHPEAQPGPHVLLAVSDTGQGMDAATIERIFEPFFTTKPEGKGTGLGLATVYGIVRQTGGHIRVESMPGKGTTFQIYFPKASPDPCATRSATDATAT